MEEPHTEGVAIHGDPESCTGARESIGEALTGACTGAVWSREITRFGVPTLLSEAEGHTRSRANASGTETPRGRRPAARAEPLCARTGRSHSHLSQMARQVAPGRPLAAIR
jgi:RNA-directed DNA polymerase